MHRHDGRWRHLGERGHRPVPVVVDPRPLLPRASPEANLAVVWYPHRDALSLLPRDVVGTRAMSEGVLLLPVVVR